MFYNAFIMASIEKIIMKTASYSNERIEKNVSNRVAI